jgi:hypothetical protein
VRYRDNYTPEHIQMLLNNNRLSDGVFLLYSNQQLISYFGVDNYNNWSTVARLVILKHFKVPLTSAFLIPKLEAFAESAGRLGVFFSFNSGNQYLYNRCPADDRMQNYERRELKTLHDNDVFTRSINVLSQYKKIDRPVLYHNTLQYILYKSFSHDIMPFEITD